MLWRPDWHANVGKSKTEVNLYYPILYTLMGISVTCGTEQGLAFILAYVLIRGVQYIRSKEMIKKAGTGVYQRVIRYSTGHLRRAFSYDAWTCP